MEARLRSWRQQIKQHRVAIGVVAIVLIVVIVFIIIGYLFDWTGFNGYNKVTITHTISGTNAGTVTKTEEYQPGKGLWDWLQLLGVLAIPIVVGFGAVWFTTRQGKVADAENTDNQRETALQGYIDKMSELLLHEKLRDSAERDEVHNIARVRTLTVLRGLDAFRKASVLQFLYESGLIEKDNRIVDLSYADLSSANLYAFDLRGADLSKVNLREADLFLANLSGTNLNSTTLTAANLFEADLNGANLGEAFLNGVDLSHANLSGANLRGTILKGTNLQGTKVTSKQLEEATFFENVTMPDGSIHE
jgi:Pentapeptide repeats (8 copies)